MKGDVMAERESLIQARVAQLDGWSCAVCPDCGTLVNEWLTEDGPDVVEYEECPMCQEAARDEEWWF